MHHKKSLGQHFLTNITVVEDIVKSAPNLNKTNIFEIGPGEGALTIPLLELSKTVTAIEYDVRLKGFLEKLKAKNNNFNFVLENALRFNFENSKQPYAIISNLPYNIGTELLLNFIKLKNKPSYMLLMFQKEVAKRVTANAGEKYYGRLSIICKALCDCTYLFDVPKEDFSPVPKVDSGVIFIKPKKQTLNPKTISKLEGLTNILFSKRRKMISTTLKSYNIPFNELEINSKKRPEELNLNELLKLIDFIT